MQGKERETGVALVVALLAVGVIVSLSAALASEFILTLRRAENQIQSEQAWQYLVGAEELARLLVGFDEDPERDHPGEAWALGVQAYEIEGGWLAANLSDLQGRFNLSSLYRPQANENIPKAVPANENERRFIRLLLAVSEGDIDESSAIAITEAVIDWMDADSNETGFGGAEDSFYAGGDPAYRAANREMQSVSELRLVNGITKELYAALAPHVSILPGGTQALNIHTATNAVLRSLAPGTLQPLPEGALEVLEFTREEGAFPSLEEFRKNAVWEKPLEAELLGERSDFYQLQVEVEYRDRKWLIKNLRQPGP